MAAWPTANQHEPRPVGFGFPGSVSPACWSSSRRSPPPSATRCWRPRPRRPRHPSTPSTVMAVVRSVKRCPGRCGLHMTHTRYTDPSGYDDATVSTAADQMRIVDPAMRLPVFASIVAAPSATLPVAGTVHNTNRLLGYDGFVGVKTGSDDAAGGCFAFRASRWIDGKRTTITGVVLGQPGHDRIAAGLGAAAAMVDRIADHSRRQARAMPDLRKPTLAPRTASRTHRPRPYVGGQSAIRGDGETT